MDKSGIKVMYSYWFIACTSYNAAGFANIKQTAETQFRTNQSKIEANEKAFSATESENSIFLLTIITSYPCHK